MNHAFLVLVSLPRPTNHASISFSPISSFTPDARPPPVNPAPPACALHDASVRAGGPVRGSNGGGAETGRVRRWAVGPAGGVGGGHRVHGGSGKRSSSAARAGRTSPSPRGARRGSTAVARICGGGARRGAEGMVLETVARRTTTSSG